MRARVAAWVAGSPRVLALAKVLLCWWRGHSDRRNGAWADVHAVAGLWRCPRCGLFVRPSQYRVDPRTWRG